MSIEYLFQSISEELKKQDIPVKNYTLPRFSTGLFSRLVNTLSLLQFKNGIVHITGDVYYAVLGAFFAKRIITIHDLSFLHRTSGITRKVLKLFWVTLPVRFSHRVTAISEATKQEILKEVRIEPQKIQVIPDFIDPIYQPFERSFNEANPRILQVGTAFNKNIERLASALENISCTLVIIGKLSPKQQEILQAKGIRFENYFRLPIEELYREYCKADMLVFVSTVEGFGMPILEAQASALPVITSNCSSMPEVAGDGALLVDPLNIESIRSGIMSVIADKKLRTSLVEAGLQNVKRFSKERVAEQYLQLYHSLSNSSDTFKRSEYS